MKRSRKIVPHLISYAYDPERIEEQANRMVKEGWLLEHFGAFHSTYRRGGAGEYEYRAQVMEAGMDRLVYAAELTEFGIEDVSAVGDFLILRKKADGTPFELYSDLDSRIAQQKKAVRYLRWGLIQSFFYGSMMLMNILTNLMDANVIGPHAGTAPISFSTVRVLLLFVASLLLLVCITGLVDCPTGLRRAKKELAVLKAGRVLQE